MTEQPKIVISEIDMERLERLLESLPGNDAGKVALEAELSRAEVRPSKDMPANVVTMNSEVRFTVSSSAEEFCLRLVYPKDVSAKGDTVSILEIGRAHV